MALSAFGNIVSLLISMVVGVFLTPYIISALGKPGYGVWLLLNSVVGYFSLMAFGIDSAIRVFVAKYDAIKDHEGSNQVINTSLAYMGGICFLGVLISMWLAPKLPEFFSIEKEFHEVLYKVFFILSIGVLLRFLTGILSSIFTAHEDFYLLNIIQTAGTLLRVVIIVLLLHFGKGLLGLSFAVLAESFWIILSSVLIILKKYPHIKFSWKYVNKNKIKVLFKYGFGTVMVIVGDMLRFNLDNFVIAKWLSSSKVGTYGVATTILSFLLTIVNNIFRVLNPRFARLSHEKGTRESQELLKQSTFLSSYVAFGIMVMTWFFGAKILRLWVGIEFQDSVMVLLLLVFSYTVAFAQNPSINLLYARSAHILLARTTLFEGFFNVILSIFLVRHYGLLGVVFGTVIPMLTVKLLLQPLFTTKVIGISKLEYSKSFVASSFSFLCIAGTSYYFGFDPIPMIEISFLRLVGEIIIVGAIYSGLVFALGYLMGFRFNLKKVF